MVDREDFLKYIFSYTARTKSQSRVRVADVDSASNGHQKWARIGVVVCFTLSAILLLLSLMAPQKAAATDQLRPTAAKARSLN